MAKLFERGDIAVRDARHGAAWFGGYEWSDLETLKADPNVIEIMDESTNEVIFNREEEEENMNEYESKNAAAVLRAVEGYMALLDTYKGSRRSVRLVIDDVYEDLSIFDWWNEYLSMSQLKDMRKFLKEAIKLGYTGYVCFNVGAVGCSNGMWAHTEPSTDGHSPNGCPCLYKSFTPSYNYWAVSDEEGNFDIDVREYKTIRELEAHIVEDRAASC